MDVRLRIVGEGEIKAAKPRGPGTSKLAGATENLSAPG
jgi:hypothetical protein